MPSRYAKDSVFDQVTAELMSKAFNDALEKLRQSGIHYPPQQEEWVRETLALRIIDTAQSGGELHLDRLREDALGYLAQAKPPPKEPSSA